MKRIERWALRNNIINNHQGAAQPKCSSLHVSWLVQECIAKFVDKGCSVYVAMLDTKKAYDFVWQKGLFYKLYTLNICPKLWRLIMKLYEKFECYVRVGNIMSDGFTIE